MQPHQVIYPGTIPWICDLSFLSGIIEMSIQGNGLEMISGHMTTSMVGIEMDLKQDLTDSSLVLVADGVEIIQFNSQSMNRFNLSVRAPRKFSRQRIFSVKKYPFDQ